MRIEETQFRARMARMGSDPALRAGRRDKGGLREHRGDGLRLGWKGWSAIGYLIALLAAAGVIVWPPVQACRYQDQTIGFSPGDSVDRCMRRGVADRFAHLDLNLKMLVRGSGR